MPPQRERFEFHARRYFLTYPQCELEKERARELLGGIFGGPFRYIIGRETHQDGAHHLHAYLEFDNPKRVRRCDYFDIDGHHPNIQTVRHPIQCQEYCTKEGDYITNMEVGRVRRTYGEILASSSSTAEFLVEMEASHARDLVLNFKRINDFANERWPLEPDNRLVLQEVTFSIPDDLNEWYQQWVTADENGKRVPGGPQSPPSSLLSSHAYG